MGIVGKPVLSIGVRGTGTGTGFAGALATLASALRFLPLRDGPATAARIARARSARCFPAADREKPGSAR